MTADYVPFRYNVSGRHDQTEPRVKPTKFVEILIMGSHDDSETAALRKDGV